MPLLKSKTSRVNLPKARATATIKFKEFTTDKCAVDPEAVRRDILCTLEQFVRDCGEHRVLEAYEKAMGRLPW